MTNEQTEAEAKISQEDLTLVTEARQKLLSLANKAERAVSEARIADLEQQVLVRNIYLKYGLPITCQIDEKTGAITYPDVKPELSKDTNPEK